MRRISTSTLWAATPKTEVYHGEIKTTYIKAREIKNVNLQTDYSEIDAAEYGDRINEMVRIRSISAPNIQKGDHIYFSEPKDECDPGEYEVISVKHGFSNLNLRRNPTIIDIRKITL